MSPASAQHEEAGHRPLPSRRATQVAFAVLLGVSVLNFVDRSIIAILQEVIKRDLDMSDAQIGALNGLAFTLIYASLALPFGWLADRRSRKHILAAAVAVWSAMTVLCGGATSFATLILARMGVAIGESANVPTIHSLFADYAPREKRATALSLWALTGPLGLMISFLGGSWLSDRIGWRLTLVSVGATGLILAPAVLLIVQPRRGAHDDVSEPDAGRSLRQSLSLIFKLRTLRWMALASVFSAYLIGVTQTWTASFYLRVHELPISTVGVAVALMLGGGGILGALLGGSIADRLGARDSRWYAWVPAIASLAAIPLGLAQVLAESVVVSMACGFAAVIAVGAFYPILPTVHQSIVPPELRSFTSAVMLVVGNALGMGFGPLVTGVVSDIFIDGPHGQDSLRYAIASSFAVGIPAALCYLCAARHLAAELPFGRRAA